MHILKKYLVPLLLTSAFAVAPLSAQNYKPVDIKPIDPSYFIPKRHDGRTYVITGGARGIGAASAIRLAHASNISRGAVDSLVTWPMATRPPHLYFSACSHT